MKLLRVHFASGIAIFMSHKGKHIILEKSTLVCNFFYSKKKSSKARRFYKRARIIYFRMNMCVNLEHKQMNIR